MKSYLALAFLAIAIGALVTGCAHSTATAATTPTDAAAQSAATTGAPTAATTDAAVATTVVPENDDVTLGSLS